MRRTTGEKIFGAANTTFLVLFSLAVLLPVAFVLKKSLDVAGAGQLGLSLVPREISLLYYRIVLADQGIWRPFLNSVYLTLVGTAVSVLFTAMGAYTLSRRDLPGRRLFIYMIVVSMMFSGGLVPLYLVVRALRLINKINGLIVVTFINGWNMILIRNYYYTIPPSLSESARMDGAGELLVFRTIVLPLALPVIAAIALFTGVGYWNMFFQAVIFINSPQRYTFQVKLQEMISVQQNMETQFDQMAGVTAEMRRNLNAEGVSSAIIVVSMIPIVLVYPALQKHFAAGILVGSLKG